MVGDQQGQPHTSHGAPNTEGHCVGRALATSAFAVRRTQPQAFGFPWADRLPAEPPLMADLSSLGCQRSVIADGNNSLETTHPLVTPRRPISEEARLPLLLEQTSRSLRPSQNPIRTPACDRPTSGWQPAACIWADGPGGAHMPRPAPLLGSAPVHGQRTRARTAGGFSRPAGHVVTLLKASSVKPRVRHLPLLRQRG